MTSYSWAKDVSGDWNTGTLWSTGTVPNSATADVTIDVTATLVPYTVTIAAGQSFTLDSLTINDTQADRNGANAFPYVAAAIDLDGTLTFAPGSAGTFGNDAAGGSLQTSITTDFGDSSEIVNAGTIDGFIQVGGDMLLTGTNGVYITNDIQALGGTVTIDTKTIAEMTGNTLFDGIYQVVGPEPATIKLGGTLEGLIVNVTTLEGPQLNSGGWTELTFNGPGTAIDEWNGTTYVAIESTLTRIAGGGTVDVLTGRDYTTANTLTIDHSGASLGAGMLNLQAGTVTAAAFDLNGGIIQGAGTIVGGVVNDGTVSALAGTLDLTGALTGTGLVEFDTDMQQGTIDTAGATLIVNSVSAGQSIVMNGDDTLSLAAPGSFAGTITAGVGDKIILQGLTATSAVVNNGSLTVFNGSQAVDALAVAGTYTADHFTASGSTLTLAAGAAGGPSISGTAAGQTIVAGGTITPFSDVTIADANVGQTETVTVTLSATANGTLSNLGAGTYNSTTGVYTVSGSVSAVTTALEALVFTTKAQQVAPGLTVTTGFTIGDVDTGGVSATDSTTTVIASSGTLLPTITGTVAGQTDTSTGTVSPFSGVAIADANIGQTETVTVTLSKASNGALSNLGGGSYDAATGVYSDTGTAAAVTTALDGLVFTPTAAAFTTPGQTIITGFTVGDTDTAGASASDAVTTVIATAPNSVSTPPSAVPDAFFGDATSDVLFANTNGDLSLWHVQDGVATAANGLGSLTGGWSVAGTGDFYGTGSSDILFQNPNGDIAQWQMQNGQAVAATTVGVTDPSHWTVVGTGDFNGTGTDGVLFEDTATGAIAQWEVQDGQAVAATTVGKTSSDWSIAAIGKLSTGAGADSIVFINSDGAVADWAVTNGQATAANSLGQTSSYWSIVGLGDFTGNGQNDLLFRGQGGEISMWTVVNGVVTGAESIGMTSSDWQIAGIGDYNGDGTSDILFRNTSGGLAAWEISGGHVSAVVNVGATSSDWTVAPAHSGITLPS